MMNELDHHYYRACVLAQFWSLIPDHTRIHFSAGSGCCAIFTLWALASSLRLLATKSIPLLQVRDRVSSAPKLLLLLLFVCPLNFQLSVYVCATVVGVKWSVFLYACYATSLKRANHKQSYSHENVPSSATAALGPRQLTNGIHLMEWC